MTKHTFDQYTKNAPAGGIEPFEAFDPQRSNSGLDFDEPEPVQATDPLAQRFFTLSEAGKIFRKTPRTMRWWADTGRIRTVKIGTTRFITEAEIQRLQAGGEG